MSLRCCHRNPCEHLTGGTCNTLISNSYLKKSNTPNVPNAARRCGSRASSPTNRITTYGRSGARRAATARPKSSTSVRLQASHSACECALLGSGFDRSKQHLLILLDWEVSDGSGDARTWFTPKQIAMNRLCRWRSPCLLIRPSLSLPPLECCLGTSPIQAEKSRADRNAFGSAILAIRGVAGAGLTIRYRCNAPL